MAIYIHFTEEQKQRANAVDLVEFLQMQGEKLLPSGREKRLTSDHSITVRGNEWYAHAIVFLLNRIVSGQLTGIVPEQ